MRKLVSVMLIMVIMAVMGATACTNSGSSGSDSDSFKVGAIYIDDQHATSGYSYAHDVGLKKAMKDVGLNPETDLFIRDNISEDDDQIKSAIDQLATKGCNIIFGNSAGYVKAISEKAEEYSDIIFSHAAGTESNDTNFNNYFGRIYQARYLAGIVAGYKSLEIKNDEIGYVSAWGTEYAETCSGINAFTLGCQTVNPNVKVHINVIHTWSDEKLEKQAAETLIDTYNCGIIAQHCDSIQPQLVAQDKNIFGCGYNCNMTEQVPDTHLVAPVFNWEVYYKKALENVMNGGNLVDEYREYYGGVKEGVCDISEFNKNCPKEAEEAVKLVRELFNDETWDVFSGVSLSFEGESGNIKLEKKDKDILSTDGKVVVKAGDKSVSDKVIREDMNYYVEGVKEGK